METLIELERRARWLGATWVADRLWGVRSALLRGDRVSAYLILVDVTCALQPKGLASSREVAKVYLACA